MSDERALVPYEVIERRILFIRGQKVMLDEHLADLYGVTTGNLNKAVRRNSDRFPSDFMFPLTDEEAKALRFHFGISKLGRGGRRYLPCVFTEQGVPCCQASCEVLGLLRQTSKSCALLSA